MPTTRKKRTAAKNEAQEFEDCLGALDDLHAKILAFGATAGFEPETPDLTTPEGDDLPESRFLVGDDESGPERGGGLALDTRVTVTLSNEDAEMLAFAILGQLRGGDPDEDVEVTLDGRLLIGAAASKDFRRALREGD